MSSIVGFSIYHKLNSEKIHSLSQAQNQALSYFEWLDQESLTIGETHLDLWGHKEVTDCVHTLPDGSVVVLIGSPHNKIVWQEVEKGLLKADRSKDFRIPWEGRTILLRVSADGKRWALWNDWLGSIPVYYAEIGNGRIASTLELTTVAAAGYTPNDFFMPGLVSLFINGQYLSDWTLYKVMKVIPPDSVMEWGDKGFRAKLLWTVEPSQDRWEAGWQSFREHMPGTP